MSTEEAATFEMATHAASAAATVVMHSRLCMYAARCMYLYMYTMHACTYT